MLVIGIAFRVYVSRNRFYRRGVGGLQQFSSYRKAVLISAFESGVKVVGTILVLGGLFFCLVVWYNTRGVKPSSGSPDTVKVVKKRAR
ncbi:hypothetical protein HGH93_29370 [Chitinophaga polysaccharea]|nr:hypothetical protein [Chitinophaga polysaccharea]